MVIIPERSGLLLLKVVKYVSLPIHLLSTFAHFYTKIQTSLDGTSSKTSKT